MAKTARRRVTAEEVREDARRTTGRASLLKLPPNVSEWKPDKAGTYTLDFLPYEITDEHHPDRVEKGQLWYKRMFFTHNNVGVNKEELVCPTSIGKKCPICEQRAKLAEDWKSNKEAITELNYKAYVAFNIIDPADSDKVAVFAFSSGKFWKPKAGGGLKVEIDAQENAALFFDTTKEGKTLKVRFTEETFDTNKFLVCTRIDFEPRKALGDEIIEKCANLDEILNVLTYDEIKTKFLGDEAEVSSRPAREPASRSRQAEPEPEPEAEPEDSDKYSASSPPKVGDWVQDEDKNIGKVKKYDAKQELVHFVDADGEMHVSDVGECSAAEEPETEPEEKEEAAEPEEPEAPAFEVGDTVKEKKGTIRGTVHKIADDGDVTVKTADGKVIVDASDLVKIEEKSDSKPEFGTGEKVDFEGDIVTFMKMSKDPSRAVIKDAEGDELTVPLTELKPVKKKAK